MILRIEPRAAARMSRVIVAALAGLALSGCLAISETSQQTQPRAEVAADAAPVAATPVPTGPVNTGRFPTFGGPLTAANVQMENDDAAKIEAQLSALGAARQAGTVSEAEYQRRLAELRLLASEHGAAMEAEIAK